jgi:hypothetical protein
MASTIEKLQTINSLIRTVLILLIVGGISAAGWFGYTTYNATELEAKRKNEALQDARRALDAKRQQLAESQQRIATQQRRLEHQAAELADREATIVEQQSEISLLHEDIAEKQAEIQRLDTSLRLHKMQRRLARLRVLDVAVDSESGKKTSTIEFVELNDQGDPIDAPREFRLDGDLVYVDYWVVKFEDKYVEQADLERGMSICLFHRIFGELQKPQDGFVLEERGTRPGAYARGGRISDFEKKIWDDFWTIANNPRRASELGIRTLHGDAVSMKVSKGKSYRITVRASGGPEIEVLDGAVAGVASADYS